jgi:hypothetical protein
LAARTKLAKAVIATGKRIYGEATFMQALDRFEDEMSIGLDIFADVQGDRYSGSLVDQGKDPATLDQQAEFVAMQIGECF